MMYDTSNHICDSSKLVYSTKIKHILCPEGNDFIVSSCLSHDEKYLCLGSLNGLMSVIKLSHVFENVGAFQHAKLVSHRLQFSHCGPVYGIVFSSDDKRIWSCGRFGIHVNEFLIRIVGDGHKIEHTEQKSMEYLNGRSYVLMNYILK